MAGLVSSLILFVVVFSMAACSPTPGEPLSPTLTRSPDPTHVTIEQATPEEENTAESVPTEQVISLGDLPVVPAISPTTLQIFRHGQELGRTPVSFSKVGDCLTASPNYLIPLGTPGAYDLGVYDYLSSTVDRITATTIREVDGVVYNPFTNPSIAAAEGCTTAGPLNELWANPNYCEPGEVPLLCEYRVSDAAISLIMFGTNDVYYQEADEFDRYLRGIVSATIEAGVIPVLSTFPQQPDLVEESLAFNRVIAQIALDYDIPLINLWLALQDLPGYGLHPEHHNQLTVPEGGCAACFIEENMDTGITVQNLITLQTLHAILEAVALAG